MAKMKAVQVPKPGADFEVVERDIPEPGPRQIRIRVLACGVCHSDIITKEGLLPGMTYPRVAGHEVAGIVDAVGAELKDWKEGDRVGVGWHGQQDGTCSSCRRGDFVTCANLKISGIHFDGGYQEYMIAPVESLAHMPESLDPKEAAPLMCAGVTTFNGLRNSGARPGDLVAVLGLGGLGHLAVQFAAKSGLRTVAIARGKDKEPLARELGAWRYIDSQGQDPAAELGKLGGAGVILATVTSGDAMAAVIGGLAPKGVFMVIGAAGSLTVSPLYLLLGSRAVKGWYSGTSIDSQDTLGFSALTGIRSRNEVFPLERAAEAYDRMMSGHARFRVVLSMGG